MTSLTDIRNAIKDALDGLEGINGIATSPAAPYPNTAWPVPISWEYDEDFDESVTWRLKVWLLVKGATVNREQTIIDPYLAPTGAKSVKAALEADPTLGGVVESIRVLRGGEYGYQTIGDNSQALAASFDVEVYAR